MASAGGMTSSGGEFVTTEKNPWFIGKQTIKYCVQVSDNFSANEETVKQTISEVFSDWLSTIKILNPISTDFKLPDGKKKSLATEFVLGDCGEDTQLWFHLGNFTDEIKESLKGMARYTAAFAGHAGVDDRTGSVTKGIVWLAPDRGSKKYIGPNVGKDFWSRKNILFNVLLHELGHMFGFEHQEDGVMNSGFPAFVIAHNTPQSTTKRFKYHKWQSLNLKICGKKMELEPEISKELLETPYVILWDVCIESIKQDENDYFNEIEILFSSEKQVVTKKYKVEFKKGSSFGTPVRTIKGKYFRDKLGSPEDYKPHSFLFLEDNRFSGYLTDGSARHPVVISKRGTRVEMNITKNNKLYEINFYIDNLNPSLEEPKKSDSK